MADITSLTSTNRRATSGLQILTHTFVHLAITLLFTAVNASGSAGSIDQMFGVGGKVTYRFNGYEDSFTAVAVQSDGKIVTGGKNGAGYIIVARYNPNGSLDNTFASGGILTIGALPSAQVEGIVLQPDGKIVIAGSRNIFGDNYAYVAARITTRGVLDATFGSGGAVLVDPSPGHDIGRDVELQADGKIVIAGAYNDASGSGNAIGVVRLNTDGTLDQSFGTNGLVVTRNTGRTQQAYSVTIQPDGRILLSANSDDIPPAYGAQTLQNFLALVRYMPDGSLDASFGDRGISLVDLVGLRFFFGDVKTLQDGRIVVAGSVGSNASFEYAFSVFGFLANGALDTGFGTSGRTVIDAGNTNSAQALAIQPDGKILVAGHTWVDGNGLDILLARLNPNGFLDPSFGSRGRVLTQVSPAPGSDYAWDIALQTDGKIVVAGDFKSSATDLVDYDAVLLRFLGDDSSRHRTQFDFDGDGKSDIGIFRPSAAEWWVRMSGDGSVTATRFGSDGDTATPADFTGDGKADIAFFRPSTGTWYVLRSEDYSYYGFPFGVAEDVPAPADFDDDGKADPAVFRPSSGSWYIMRSGDSAVTSTQFGIAGDQPVAADFDGDGKADVAIYRPNGATGGEWWGLKSTGGVFSVSFGSSTDKTAVGDWTGDGKADCAFFRPADGSWYVLRSEDQTYFSFPFGISTDVPAPGDYDGDGKLDAAVFRQPDSQWFVSRSSGGVTSLSFGADGDVPVPSVYVR